MPWILWIAILLLCHSDAESDSPPGIVEAQHYHHHSTPQWEWAMDFLEKHPFAGHECILDVGCGDGKITALLASQLPQGRAVGMDISPSMIHFAAETFPASLHSNLTFLVGDVTKSPFEGQFDVALALCSLHWVHDQQTALINIQKSLAPGGLAMITIPYKSPLEAANILVQTDKWAHHFPNFHLPRVYFGKDEYTELLLKAGLQPVSIELSSVEHPFANRQAFLGYLKPLLNFASHLSDDLFAEFTADLADAMIVASPQTCDGTVLIPFYKMEVVAIKSVKKSAKR